MITVTHAEYGSKTFDHPRDAQAFIEQIQSFKKIGKDVLKELTIDNPSGVSLSAFASHIPQDAQDLIELLEQTFGGNIVKEWRWMVKRKSHGFATGRTFYFNRGTINKHRTKRVLIVSDNSKPEDYLGVVIHEFSHGLVGPDVNHSRLFYRTMWHILYMKGILPDNIAAACRALTTAREWDYIKSSRYWFAEMFKVESILKEYEREEKTAARRPTKEEMAQKALDLMWGDES